MDYPEENNILTASPASISVILKKQRNRAMYFPLIFIIILKCSMRFPVISVFI